VAETLRFVTRDCCEERREMDQERTRLLMVHERELRDDQFETRDVALKTQAVEYERRLGELNHNLRMMLDERKAFFTRDAHDAYVTQHQQTVDLFRTQMNDVQKDIGILNTRLVTWTAAIGAGFAILNIVLHFWAK